MVLYVLGSILVIHLKGWPIRSKICQIKIKCDDSGNANNASDVKRWLLLLHYLIIKAFGNKSIMSRSQMPTKSSSYQYRSIWIVYTSLSTIAILRCCLQFLSVLLTLFKHFCHSTHISYTFVLRTCHQKCMMISMVCGTVIHPLPLLS